MTAHSSPSGSERGGNADTEVRVALSDHAVLSEDLPPALPKPEVTRCGALDMQVCVPEQWTDEQATAFANSENMAGTQHGWLMRKQGSEYLAGCDERVKCKDRAGCVHIMFDC